MRRICKHCAETFWTKELMDAHSKRCPPNYRAAYEILLEFFDSISDEQKPEVDKRLKELGL